MSKITMQNIADHLNISKNSVSQALRDTNGVSNQTKQAVIETAKKLGYVYEPNKKKNDNMNVLLLSTNFALSQTSFFGEILKNIQTISSDKNLNLTIETITEELLFNKRLPDNLGDYDGILILSHSDNQWIKQIIDTNIPTVLIDHHDPLLRADAILTKNSDGAFLAISELEKRNYKTVGFIGDIKFSPSYRERYRGFKRGIDYYQLDTYDEINITQIEENQGALFAKLNELKKLPDAWFCVNSGLAFMLNSYLQSRGLNIPHDIGTICFDDTEFTRMAHPMITNVATDLKYMGELALDTLIKRINYPEIPYVHKQIVPNLNIRESL